MENKELKICKKCNLHKHVSCFRFHKAYKDNLHSFCKDCFSFYYKEWWKIYRLKNPLKPKVKKVKVVKVKSKIIKPIKDKLINKDISCVYMITNPIGQIYIGSTKNFKRRVNEYKCLSSVMKQSKISNSLIKYGFENHVFEIIELCNGIEELKKRERYYQDLLNPFGESGLCLKKEGYGNVKSWYCQESRDKTSNTKTGKFIKTRYSHPILDFNTGVYYDGLRDLSRISGVPRHVYNRSNFGENHIKYV